MIPKKYKNFLYSEPHYFLDRPSFTDGVASIYDIYNAKHTTLHFSPKFDYKSMKSDFDLVGRDMCVAIQKFNHEFEKH